MDYLEEINSLRDQVSFRKEISLPEKFTSVVIAGMGGSGIAGRIFKDIYGAKPVVIVDSYSIPKFVDSSTFFIAISYSGNTAETISALEEAKKRGAKVAAITSGGMIEDMVPDPVIIPRGLQPRSAIGFLLIPLLRGFGIVTDSDLGEARSTIEKTGRDTSYYEQVAMEIHSGKRIPVIYGTSPFGSIAYRWKTQFNENAKILSYSSYFPELNHNDTMALEKTFRKDEFYFIVLTSGQTEPILRRRIKITSELCNVSFNEINGEGDSTASIIFTLIHKGDYISYFLARYRNVDPRDVAIIEELKERLKGTI
jgi:glucose/mannose-6-phosphate isomerase